MPVAKDPAAEDEALSGRQLERDSSGSRIREHAGGISLDGSADAIDWD